MTTPPGPIPARLEDVLEALRSAYGSDPDLPVRFVHMSTVDAASVLAGETVAAPSAVAMQGQCTVDEAVDCLIEAGPDKVFWSSWDTARGGRCIMWRFESNMFAIPDVIVQE